MKGYENANSVALDLWEEVYPNAPLIALTDTFSTAAFFKANVSTSAAASPFPADIHWHRPSQPLVRNDGRDFVRILEILTFLLPT